MQTSVQLCNCLARGADRQKKKTATSICFTQNLDDFWLKTVIYYYYISQKHLFRKNFLIASTTIITISKIHLTHSLHTKSTVVLCNSFLKLFVSDLAYGSQKIRFFALSNNNLLGIP